MTRTLMGRVMIGTGAYLLYCAAVGKRPFFLGGAA